MGFKVRFEDDYVSRKAEECRKCIGWAVAFVFLGLPLAILVILSIPLGNSAPILALDGVVVLVALLCIVALNICAGIFALKGKRRHDSAYYSLLNDIEEQVYSMGSRKR